jgi:lambda family phage tail tape measure protein
MIELGVNMARVQKDLGRARHEIDQFRRHVDKAVGGAGASLAAYFSARAVLDFNAAIFQTGMKAEATTNAFKAITGSMDSAKQEMGFLRRESDRLKLNFWEVAGSYRNIAAAARGTSLAGQDVQEVFVGIVEAGRAVNMTGDQMSGALYALSQMISKGKVTAEEMVQQLGERLPGAMQIAARAMNTTTKGFMDMMATGRLVPEEFIPKFAKALREEFGEAAVDAAMSAVASVDYFKGALEDLRYEASRGDFMKQMVASTNEFTDILKDPNIVNGVRGVAIMFSDILYYTTQITTFLAKWPKLLAYMPGFSGPGLVLQALMNTGESRGPGPDEISNKISVKLQHPDVARRGKGGSAGVGGSSAKAEAERAKREAEELANFVAGLEDDIARFHLNSYDYARYSLGETVKEYKAKYGDIEMIMAWEASETKRIQAEKEETLKDFAAAWGSATGNMAAASLRAAEQDRDAWIKAGVDKKLALALYEKETAEIRLQYAEDWRSGAIRALKEYAEEAKNVGQQVEDTLGNAFQGLEDAWVNFCQTGKFEFTEFANSVIADMARMVFRANVSGPLLSLFQSLLGGGGGMSGGAASVGDIIGGAMPSSSAKALGASSGSVGGNNVTVINNSSEKATVTESKNSTGGRDIQVLIGEAGAVSVTGNGAMQQAINKTYGLRPRMTYR